MTPTTSTLTVTGVKPIDGEGPYLTDHFPQIRIFPGVLIVDTVVRATAEALERPLRLTAVRSLRFLAPLYPGDEMRYSADVAETTDTVVVTAVCRRGDGVRIATMTLGCGWSS